MTKKSAEQILLKKAVITKEQFDNALDIPCEKSVF
jgi:hypothetical protein